MCFRSSAACCRSPGFAAVRSRGCTEAVRREPPYAARPGALVVAEDLREDDCRPGGKTLEQDRGEPNTAFQVLKRNRARDQDTDRLLRERGGVAWRATMLNDRGVRPERAREAVGSAAPPAARPRTRVATGRFVVLPWQGALLDTRMECHRALLLVTQARSGE